MCAHDGSTSKAPRLSAISSLLELGAGTGLCAVTAAMLGAEHVVATDGDPISCSQCALNAERNGVGRAVVASRLLWGERASLNEALRTSFADRRGPEMIIAADVVYGRCRDELEGTLRALIRLTPCAWIVLSWKRRGFEEEAFLSSLDDLGSVRTVWRATVHELLQEGRGSIFLWPGDPLYKEVLEAADVRAWRRHAARSRHGFPSMSFTESTISSRADYKRWAAACSAGVHTCGGGSVDNGDGDGGGGDDGDEEGDAFLKRHEVGVTVLEVRRATAIRGEDTWTPPSQLRMLALSARRKKGGPLHPVSGRRAVEVAVPVA